MANLLQMDGIPRVSMSPSEICVGDWFEYDNGDGTGWRLRRLVSVSITSSGDTRLWMVPPRYSEERKGVDNDSPLNMSLNSTYIEVTGEAAKARKRLLFRKVRTATLKDKILNWETNIQEEMKRLQEVANGQG